MGWGLVLVLRVGGVMRWCGGKGGERGGDGGREREIEKEKEKEGGKS